MTDMKCHQCGSEIPVKSKFCLSCGAPIQSVEERLPTVTPDKKRSKVRILAIVCGLLLVVGIAYAMTLMNSRSKLLEAAQAAKAQRTSVVVAPTLPDNGSNVLKSPKVDGKDQNLLNAGKSDGKDSNVPADVLAYLEHVKKIEDERKSMRTDLTPAFEMLKKAYNIQYDAEDEVREKDQKEISDGLSQYTQKWQQIVSDFNSVKAPAGCDKLASTYGEALGRYSETMVNIQTGLDKGDASALYSMLGSAQSDVDSALSKADDALAETCQNYGIDKTFSISTDKGVTSLLMPNIPGK